MKMDADKVFPQEMRDKAKRYKGTVKEPQLAQVICDNVIKPEMDRINEVTGQENHPMYLAYALIFLVSRDKIYECKDWKK